MEMENNFSESFDDTYDKKPELFGHPYKELQDYFSNCSVTGELDLGCGQGRDSLYLASIGYKVTAVDSSKVGVEQMVNKAESKGFEIHGIVDDIQNIKLDKKFNVILFDMLIHGFEDAIQLELLGKYSNSLNEDGILCIVFPDDLDVNHFMNMLKSFRTNWNILDEILINDIPKIEGEINDYKFKMIVVQITN
jgi:SAM-dependent methyltransferase